MRVYSGDGLGESSQPIHVDNQDVVDTAIFEIRHKGKNAAYLDDETEQKVVETARDLKLSKSQSVAGIIRGKLQSDWPQSVRGAAGSRDSEVCIIKKTIKPIEGGSQSGPRHTI